MRFLVTTPAELVVRYSQKLIKFFMATLHIFVAGRELILISRRAIVLAVAIGSRASTVFLGFFGDAFLRIMARELIFEDFRKLAGVLRYLLDKLRMKSPPIVGERKPWRTFIIVVVLNHNRSLYGSSEINHIQNGN
jgi:hypothetical protein